jgi:hypothetical protein
MCWSAEQFSLGTDKPKFSDEFKAVSEVRTYPKIISSRFYVLLHCAYRKLYYTIIFTILCYNTIFKYFHLEQCMNMYFQRCSLEIFYENIDTNKLCLLKFVRKSAMKTCNFWQATKFYSYKKYRNKTKSSLYERSK